MTASPDVAAIARGLTKAQRKAIIRIAEVLDAQAGDGMGTEINGEIVWLDMLCVSLAEDFGLDPDVPLGLAVRAHLQQGPEA